MSGIFGFFLGNVKNCGKRDPIVIHSVLHTKISESIADCDIICFKYSNLPQLKHFPIKETSNIHVQKQKLHHKHKINDIKVISFFAAGSSLIINFILFDISNYNVIMEHKLSFSSVRRFVTVLFGLINIIPVRSLINDLINNFVVLNVYNKANKTRKTFIVFINRRMEEEIERKRKRKRDDEKIEGK